MFPKMKDSQENKTNCFPRDHTLSVYSNVKGFGGTRVCVHLF